MIINFYLKTLKTLLSTYYRLTIKQSGKNTRKKFDFEDDNVTRFTDHFIYYLLSLSTLITEV